MLIRSEDYQNFIGRIFKDENADNRILCRSITFQVTGECNLCCSYCYEHNKNCGAMSLNTAKKCVDTILNEYNKDSNFIGDYSKGLVIDFIGGEPLLEAKLIEQICDYWMDQCESRNIPLAPFTRFSLATNGQLWFTPDAQHLFKKYHNFLSVTVSIDGVKELHDKYRINKYGEGSFDRAYLAFIDGKQKYGWCESKMTFVPNSFKYIFDSVKFMIANGCTEIHCNYAFEPVYTIGDAKNLYFELEKLANYLIDTKFNGWISILDDFIGNENNSTSNYCGGTGNMLSFAPDGKIYPCIRFAPISVGNKRAQKMVLGDCYNGLYATKEQRELKNYLDSITKASQSSQKCMECPIASGCGWCSGNNYDMTGDVNKRVTNICNAHKGRVLSTCYYFNKRFLELGDCNAKAINMSFDEAAEIIGEEKAKELFDLQERAAQKILNT